MSAEFKTKRTYTARSINERVIRLLDEAAELVRKGCVEPSTGVGTERAVKKSVAQAATQVGKKTRDALTQAGLDSKTSRIVTEAAVKASKEALSPLLRNATAVVSEHTSPKGKTRKFEYTTVADPTKVKAQTDDIQNLYRTVNSPPPDKTTYIGKIKFD